MPEQEKKSKISASRKLMLKSLMVAKAKEELEQELIDKEEEKQRYLDEKVPALQTSRMSFAELQELCQELHTKIDVVDEERYDIEAKVLHNTREIKDLNIKVLDLRGKFKRPNLRRSRKRTQRRKRQWKSVTGGRTWRPCLEWRAARRCLMPPRGQRSEQSHGVETEEVMMLIPAR
ncbi:hypothetical protein MHYP_G00336500 [Metynnis hypsauchen]